MSDVTLDSESRKSKREICYMSRERPWVDQRRLDTINSCNLYDIVVKKSFSW
jgi:hypothetical protein